MHARSGEAAGRRGAPPGTPRFRLARPADAEAVARLHADSWRRHYRGAYSDAFLDGDVLEDRRAVWAEQLAGEDTRRYTVLAEEGGLLGFASTIFEEHPRWGALVENLHVGAAHQRRGIGARLLALTAEALGHRERVTGLYLWVLEQNRTARAFYEARGARCVGRDRALAPGGVAARLRGSPARLRYAWRDPGVLLEDYCSSARR